MTRGSNGRVRIQYAAATKLVAGHGGKLVSSRSKTGDPECSKAVSDWKTKGQTPTVAKKLAECRAVARGKAKAHLQAAAGHEARAQHIEHILKSGGPITAKARKTKAQALKAARAEKQKPKVATEISAKSAKGRGTEDRIKRAREIISARQRGDMGTAESLRVRNRPLGIERVEEEARQKRIARNKKNVEIVKEHLKSGGQSLVISQTKPRVFQHPENVVGVDAQGNIIVRESKKHTAALVRGQQEKVFVQGARKEKARTLREALAEKRKAKVETPPPAKSKPPREERLAVLASRAGGRARDLEARGKIAESDVERARRAKFREAIEAAKGKAQPSFGLKMGSPSGGGFADVGKGKTGAMFEEMKGAAARDLPGQKSFLGGEETEFKAAPREHADLSTAPSVAQDPFVARVMERARAAKESRLKAAQKLREFRRDPSSHTEHPTGVPVQLKTNLIHFDPERFQYKIGASTKTGSVGSLAGVRQFNPEFGGILQVWKDPKDGKVYVVNGHNRLDLAKRTGTEKVTVQFLAAPNAEAAKAKGALTNIAEGRGTSIDAANFFRSPEARNLFPSTETIKEDLERHGIPMRERVATEGMALAKLSDPLFRRVVEGTLPSDKAAMIGGSGLTHAQQGTVVKQLDKASKSRPITTGTLQELLDNARQAGSVKAGGFDLFGANEEETSLALHRARVQSGIRDRLSREKRLFGTVAKSKAATELGRAGNVINIEQSGAVSREAGGALDVFDQLKNRSGTMIPKYLNQAAERIHAGENPKKVQDETYAKVLEEARQIIGPEARSA